MLALVATGLLATGAGGSVAAESKAGGTLTIGLAEDPDALDPTLARTFVGRMVFLHMCEKLYDLNARLRSFRSSRPRCRAFRATRRR